ncbi:MAG: transcriptional regulator [Desulfobacteraceae bacterium]|nr:transcriptional regulator [Desulfobacteraceae bacterium]
MELTQILPLEKWQELELELFEKYKLQGSVFDTKGIRITSTKNWANNLCPAIKAIDKGQSFICAVAHMNMSNQAEKTKGIVTEECDAGLLKIVAPIFYKGEFLGVFGGCGLLAEDGEADEFSIQKITDMDEEKIAALASDIPRISLETMKSVRSFLKEKQAEVIPE